MVHVSRRSGLLFISSVALSVAAANATAGGFEKATMWNAEFSALAGAAVSSVDDSSAIFYNPAGLAFIEGSDISIHLSPTITQTNGPANGTDYIKGEKNFVPNGGFTGAYRLDEKLVLGYGIYGAGGASASYEDVTVGSFLPAVGDYSTDIKVIEAGLGLGYRINNNWSVGGTYRFTYAAADIDMLSTIDVSDMPGEQAAGVLVGYNEMSGSSAFSFRLGAMFRSDDQRFGWGLNIRSEVDIEADGDANLYVAPGISLRGDVTAETALPFQVSTGVDYLVAPEWRLFGEVTYSQYSDNEKIEFDTNVPGMPAAININWDDQYNIRVATEYTGVEGWALRAGYILTIPVVTEEYATPTFSTPANAHTVTFGAGTLIMDGKVNLDVAAEYNHARNDSVKGGGELVDGSPAASGRYDTRAYAVHVSARYNF